MKKIIVILLVLLGVLLCTSCQQPVDRPTTESEFNEDSGVFGTDDRDHETDDDFETESTPPVQAETDDGFETESTPPVEVDSGIRVYEIATGTDCGIPHLNHTSDISLREQMNEQCTSNKMEATCVIPDNSYNGNFMYEVISPYYQDDYIAYKASDEFGREVRFNLSSHDGRVMYFFRVYRATEEDGPILSEAECISLVEKFIFEEVQVQGTFKLIFSEYMLDPETDCGYYSLEFWRYLGEQKTSEYIWVTIGERGHIICVSANMLGSMNDVTVPAYDENEIQLAVERKLDAIYGEVADEYSYTYEVMNSLLTRLKDGKLYLRYEIISKLYHNENGGVLRDGTILLIPLQTETAVQ